MFYNHVYLKRNGRFGLIWLAATQARVLTKRELYTVNISMACSDILEHITGYSGRETYKRPKRFSLYLSSQLMYGSVIILHKQWESLLSETSTLLRRVHPEFAATGDIDLLPSSKHDLATLESCMPVNIKDKHYDPFFGTYKESTADIDKLLDSWDKCYLKTVDLSMMELPLPIRPELGSPNSVSDPSEIQIKDRDAQDMSQMMHGEPDLPDLDNDNLLLLDQSGEEVYVSAKESPASSTHLPDVNFTRLSQPTEKYVNEMTPSVKTGALMPGTPQKRKKHLHSPDRKKRPKDDIQKPAGEDSSIETGLFIPDVPFSYLVEQRQEVLFESPAPVIETVSPIASHDWPKKVIDLTPIKSTSIHGKKQKASKVIIDEDLQIPRSDIKKNMLSTTDIFISMVSSEQSEGEFLTTPSSNTYESETDSSSANERGDTDTSSLTSPSTTVLKRKTSQPDKQEEESTPLKKKKSSSLFRASSSIEHEREGSLVSMEGESRSRSLLAPSDDSLTVNSASLSKSAPNLETEFGSEVEPNFPALPSLLEEHEMMHSPPLLVPPEDVENVEDVVVALGSTSTDFMQCYNSNVETEEGPITFRKLWPPTFTSRAVAAKMFMELCILVSNRKIKVYQEFAYGDIFINNIEN